MKTFELECAKCGAPLNADGSASIVECIFCHTRNFLPGTQAVAVEQARMSMPDVEIHEARRRQEQNAREREMSDHNRAELERIQNLAAQRPAQSTQRAKSPSMSSILAVAVLVMLGGAAAAVQVLTQNDESKLAQSAVDQALANANAAIARATQDMTKMTGDLNRAAGAGSAQSANALLTLKDFSSLPEDMIQRAVDLDGVQQGSDLPLDAAIARLRDFALAWHPSVELANVRFEGLAPNGSLPMTDARSKLQVAFRATGKSGSALLRFALHDGRVVVSALPTTIDPGVHHSFDTRTCPVERAIAAAASRHALPKGARINGYLTEIDQHQKDWYLRDDESGWPLSRVRIDRCIIRR